MGSVASCFPAIEKINRGIFLNNCYAIDDVNVYYMKVLKNLTARSS